MESVLIERWLGGLDAIAVVDEASVSVVREAVRRECAAASLDEAIAGSLVNVASELAHNQLAHAKGGRIALRQVARAGERGVEIIAADRGEGIRDPREAIRGKAHAVVPVSGSLGVGLSAVIELADEVDIDVRLHEGTCVCARKFASGGARRRCVGIFGRPIDGERIAGDDAGFVRDDDALVIALADGLGHGADARVAATRSVTSALDGAFTDAIERADVAAAGTRGAVMTVARIDSARRLDFAMVGNASAYVCSRRQTRRRIGSTFVLGSRGSRARVMRDVDALAMGEVLVVFSDGLSTQLSLENEDTLLHAHPIVIAQECMERFGTTRDDATVLVVT